MIGDYDANKFVEHISFNDLSFLHSDWYLDKLASADFQAAAFLNTSAIFIKDARNIEFNNASVQHVGFYAIQVHRGCTDISITGCMISDMGAGGVRIGEMVTTKYTTSKIRVTNNFITDGGNVFMEGIGVIIHRSSDNLVDKNTISYLFYTGISVGWTWGYAPDSNAHRNMITNNRISHVGQYQLNDMGAIYTLGISNGTVLRGNIIEEVHTYMVLDFGIYLDEGASNILVENNHVSRTGSAGFFQHYGQNNMVRNNYFENSIVRDGSISIGDAEDHLCYSFINNTVVHTSPGRPVITQHGGGATLTTKQYVFDQNKYINCVPFEPLTVEVNSPKHEVMIFSRWQQVFGQDQHSTIVPCTNY
jgi:parallel beta-helix repeat protein